MTSRRKRGVDQLKQLAKFARGAAELPAVERGEGGREFVHGRFAGDSIRREISGPVGCGNLDAGSLSLFKKGGGFCCALLLLADLAACGETNLFLARPLSLTPAQARLNASPFFYSEVDDFKKVTRHWMKFNPVEPESRPVMSFGALLERPEMGEPKVYFLVAAIAFDGRDWADLHTNSLAIVVDGVHRITALPSPILRSFNNEIGGGVTEGGCYFASEDALRLLAGAKRVQFRIDGERFSIQRSLDATNVARFKVFVNTFIDCAR
jgi:hypothetical protein